MKIQLLALAFVSMAAGLGLTFAHYSMQQRAEAASSLTTQDSRLGTRAYPQTEFCTRVRPQLLDADAAALRVPEYAAYNRAGIAATEAQFDSLCSTDSRLGTHEAEIFLQEETDRSGRILAALKAVRAVGSEQ